MRRLALLVLALLCVAPAAAQESVADQVSDAYRTFAGGLTSGDFLILRYGERVFEGAAGKWARLGGPNKDGVETYGVDRDRVCGTKNAVTISTPAPASAAIENTPPGGSFVQHYSLVAGSTFAEHTDPVEYLAALGFDPDKKGAAADQQRAIALTYINGIVQIYRPSPDVIVMTRDRGYPLVFARCPG